MATPEPLRRLYSNDGAPLLEGMSGDISPIEEDDDAELQNEVAINSGMPREHPNRLSDSLEEGSLEAYIEGSLDAHSKPHSRADSRTNLLDAISVHSPLHSPTHSEKHSPTHSATHSPTHSATHSTGGKSGSESESELLLDSKMASASDLMGMMLVQHQTPDYPKDSQELLVDAFPPEAQPPAKTSMWTLLKQTVRCEVEYYRKLSWMKKIVYWLEAPLTLLRNMTIPVVMEERYDKFLLLTTAFGMPLFIFHKSERALSELMFGLPSWLVLLGISLVLFVFFACCMPFEGAPKQSMFFVRPGRRESRVDHPVRVVLHVDHVGRRDRGRAGGSDERAGVDRGRAAIRDGPHRARRGELDQRSRGRYHHHQAGISADGHWWNLRM